MDAPGRIFSGIQPTGRKHLGNFIGAIRQYVEGQERGDPAIFCIVDLHATTVVYDPPELREKVYDTTAILLAAGLDPDRCILFRQSDFEEHTELTAADGTVLRVLRTLHPAQDGAPQAEPGAAGHVAGAWEAPDGTRAQGLMVLLLTPPPAP